MPRSWNGLGLGLGFTQLGLFISCSIKLVCSLLHKLAWAMQLLPKLPEDPIGLLGVSLHDLVVHLRYRGMQLTGSVLV